jgi:hypothetical protein
MTQAWAVFEHIYYEDVVISVGGVEWLDVRGRC